MDSELLIIKERLQRLEAAVFGAQATAAKPAQDISELFTQIAALLRPQADELAGDDWLVFQATLPAGAQGGAMMQASSLNVLDQEEDDESVARLCGVLASKQRVLLLRSLARQTASSGELVELTGMAGGHLHHHLRDLLSLGLVEKNSEGKYRATPVGINAYLTVAAFHRRLSYDRRKSFWSPTETGGETDEQ